MAEASPLTFKVLDSSGVELICGSCGKGISGFADQIHNLTLIVAPHLHGELRVNILLEETGQEFALPLLLPQ